ncbi:4-amino-4-deoxychorismate lyase [Caulobacter sp. Root1455]|uniref:aminotransferase class IV n=1 Tax=Caulobacter sp. Root1455 TaxID=1736465 RepID=UPI0007004B6F|nr:aminotransferase class IV [Caulobacter sp. Root1455]KQZ06474.1 4-amino-4-deoxychorismate lyase [Caulobacter sp. Root1455]
MTAFPLDAAFPLDDRGLLLGDGLFETMLWTGEDLPHLDAHLARMAAGCETLGLPAFDLDEARARCLAAPGEAGLGEIRAAVRLTLTAGSGGRGLDRPAAPVLRLAARAAAAPPVTTPVDLVLAKTRRNEGSPAARLKTLSYLDNVLARAEAKAAGADEAVMRNNHGDLTCAAAANLFWIIEGRLFTPALHCGVLNGIARGRVLEAARTLDVEVHEVATGAEALDEAEAVFLTNSLIGVRPARRFEGETFGPHALVERLGQAVTA